MLLREEGEVFDSLYAVTLKATEYSLPGFSPEMVIVESAFIGPSVGVGIEKPSDVGKA